MKEQFIEKRFRQDALTAIANANVIIGEYQRQGFRLTLRQLYYQFVARGLIPNKQTEYKRLGSIVNDARLAGLIDWSAIEDRTRAVEFIYSLDSPRKGINDLARTYQEDLWRTQIFRPEVWVEKEALIGVFENICQELRVPYFACRGYTSQSLAYEAGKRFRRYYAHGRRPIVFHFGDHDPSGIDMSRDNGDRLRMFSGYNVELRRLALNMDQIEEHAPPPNPAKETDARFNDYLARYGEESWELDALDPTILSDLVRDAIGEIRNEEKWREAEEQEDRNRELLIKCADRWDGVVAMLDD